MNDIFFEAKSESSDDSIATFTDEEIDRVSNFTVCSPEFEALAPFDYEELGGNHLPDDLYFDVSSPGNRNDKSKFKALAEELIEELGLHNKSRHLLVKAVSTILFNLCKGCLAGKGIMISRNASTYPKIKQLCNAKFYTYHRIRMIVDAFIVADYIIYCKGSKYPFTAMRTRISASDLLKAKFQQHGIAMSMQDLLDQQELADSDKGYAVYWLNDPKPIPHDRLIRIKKLDGSHKFITPTTRENRRLIKPIEQYNSFMRGVEVTIDINRFFDRNWGSREHIYHNVANSDILAMYGTMDSGLRLLRQTPASRTNTITSSQNRQAVTTGTLPTSGAVIYPLSPRAEHNTATSTNNHSKLYHLYSPSTITNSFGDSNSDNAVLRIGLTTDLYRTFCHGSLDKGGRFYGAETQGLNSRSQRPFIHINGQPVTEIDYSSFHIRMLYHIKGIDYTGDPYNIFAGNDPMRRACKTMLLAAINARNDLQATLGFQYSLFKMFCDRNKRATAFKIREFMKCNNLSNASLLDMLKKEHTAISDKFCSNSGVELQHRDSELALTIMSNLIQKNIPVLCMHDSFIVQRHYAEELQTQMHKVYYDTFGFECKTDIKY